MLDSKKAVYFFCADPTINAVAGNVFQASAALYTLAETDLVVDGYPVLGYTDPAGNLFYFVRTAQVINGNYERYLPVMNGHFADCDVAGLVTWHEGQNAPDAILTIHTTGDVDSGCFGSANSGYMRNLLLGMEKNRQAAGLDGYRVTTEATHWSGMVNHGGDPRQITEYPVPLMDIEIGSSPERWADPVAARVLAQSLVAVFTGDGRRVRNLLCAGGVHFEPAFAGAIFETWGDSAFGVSHILANQWLITGEYEGEGGPEKLEACLASIQGGIEGIVFHDKLKGAYKDQFRALARKYNIPVIKHQGLRRPGDIWPAD